MNCHRIYLLTLFFLSLTCLGSSCAKQRFNFELVSTFPEAAGLKGYYAMAHDSGYFIMGGSTFPVPQNQGGPKVYFDTIYQLDISTDKQLNWKLLDNRLPHPMAEGTCLQLHDGILIIGGHNTDTIFNQVTHVSWDADNATFNYRLLPALPTPCFYPAATVWNNKVYLAGGDNGSGGIHNFWVMDLGVHDLKWKPLAIFSGSDGHDIERLEEIGKDYRLPNDILVYSAINDTWNNEEKMPLGVIGVPLLSIEDGFILASGEYSPALRADTVYHIKVNQGLP